MFAPYDNFQAYEKLPHPLPPIFFFPMPCCQPVSHHLITACSHRRLLLYRSVSANQYTTLIFIPSLFSLKYPGLIPSQMFQTIVKPAFTHMIFFGCAVPRCLHPLLPGIYGTFWLRSSTSYPFLAGTNQAGWFSTNPKYNPQTESYSLFTIVPPSCLSMSCYWNLIVPSIDSSDFMFH